MTYTEHSLRSQSKGRELFAADHSHLEHWKWIVSHHQGPAPKHTWSHNSLLSSPLSLPLSPHQSPLETLLYLTNMIPSILEIPELSCWQTQH